MKAPNGEFDTPVWRLFDLRKRGHAEVTAMSTYRIDPRKQFSKRLAWWTALFWFFYMTWLSVIMILEPSAALYTVYMGLIVTVVMTLNVWAYTKNSIYEKGAFALLNKTEIEIGIKNKAWSSKEEDSADEGGGNG